MEFDKTTLSWSRNSDQNYTQNFTGGQGGCIDGRGGGALGLI